MFCLRHVFPLCTIVFQNGTYNKNKGSLQCTNNPVKENKDCQHICKIYEHNVQREAKKARNTLALDQLNSDVTHT